MEHRTIDYYFTRGLRTNMGLSDRAIHILFFDFVFNGLLAIYDASFGPSTSLVSQILLQLNKVPPSGFFATGVNPLQFLVGLAQFMQWFALEMGLILLLLFVIVPITAVPGVPFMNFIMTAFQAMLILWFWTMVKPSGGVPT